MPTRRKRREDDEDDKPPVRASRGRGRPATFVKGELEAAMVWLKADTIAQLDELVDGARGRRRGLPRRSEVVNRSSLVRAALESLLEAGAPFDKADTEPVLRQVLAAWLARRK